MLPYLTRQRLVLFILRLGDNFVFFHLSFISSVLEIVTGNKEMSIAKGGRTVFRWDLGSAGNR